MSDSRTITKSEKEILKEMFIGRASSSTLKLLKIKAKDYEGNLNKVHFLITANNWQSVSSEVINAYVALKNNKEKSKIVEEVRKSYLKVNSKTKGKKRSNNRQDKLKDIFDSKIIQKKEKIKSTTKTNIIWSKKPKQTEQTFLDQIKLTHRFKTIEYPTSKISFDNEELVFNISMKQFRIQDYKIYSLRAKFNSKRKIKLKVNTESIKIDKSEKNRFINTLGPIKKQVLNSPNKEAKQRETKSNQSKKSKKKESKKKLVKRSNQTFTSNSWYNLIFRNKYVLLRYNNFSYKFPQFIQSREYLNDIIELFNFRNLKYEYEVDHKKEPVKLTIPEDVFKMVTLAKRIYQFKYPDYLDSFRPVSISKTEMGVNFTEFSLLLGHSKNYYLNILMNNHNENVDIKYIPEAIYGNNEFKKVDPSYLFTLNFENNRYLVWESGLVNKATYIFDITSSDENMIIKNRVVDFLTSKFKYKRTALRRTDFNAIKGLKKVKGINHKYYRKGDLYWIDV